MRKQLFPHFPRIFSAGVVSVTGRIILWGLLVSLVLFNVWAKLSLADNSSESVLAAINNPQSIPFHMTLARRFWETGNLPAAQRELSLAQELVQSLSTQRSRMVLGVTSEPVDQLRQWELELGKLKEEYQFWQNIVEEHPDFRDAYIALSAISYQLSHMGEAKLYGKKALSLDPNNVLSQSLLRFLASPTK